MSSESFWAEACTSALSRPLQTPISAAYTSCGVTVRCVLFASQIIDNELPVAVQIAAFCASALAGGTMFWWWRRMDGEGRRQVWRLYGWFSGLMCCGSCFGAVAWCAHMQYLVSILTVLSPSSTLTHVHLNSLFSQLESWFAAFGVTYAIEFMCLSLAKLMVLDRMADFAAFKLGGLSRRWTVAGRVVVAAIIAGNVVGLGGSIAAAVYFQRTSNYYSAASAAYAANNTADGLNFHSLAKKELELALPIQSLQECCEAAVLLLIVVAFAVVGAACARRIRSALLQATDAAAASLGRQLQWQIVGTAAFVFVTFLLRAVYAIMIALVNQLMFVGRRSSTCAINSGCDMECHNVYRLMQLWLLFTPQFPLTVMLISSPLSLLVALWGMTSDRTLQLMRSNRRQMVAMREKLIRGTN